MDLSPFSLLEFEQQNSPRYYNFKFEKNTLILQICLPIPSRQPLNRPIIHDNRAIFSLAWAQRPGRTNGGNAHSKRAQGRK